MRLFFAGSEIPSHRKVLRELEVTDVALSFVGLTRKVKRLDKWRLEDKFPRGVNILLDSGAYSINKEGSKFTDDDAMLLADNYMAYVEANVDRVDAVTDFDVLAFGLDWIERQRQDFYDRLPREKFIPIWHAEWGIDYLEQMAEKYPRIGITTTEFNNRDLTPLLNTLVRSKGTRLHGVAMTHVDQMSAINWDSVSSTSWISPQQFGDTIVWTGRELKRYPMKYKEQARKRYRTLFEREGFDAEKIADDDSTEVLRLSIWSWQQLVQDIDKHSHGSKRVTTPPKQGESRIVETEQGPVDTHTGEVRKSVATTRRRETSVIPVLGRNVREEEYTDDDGVTQTREVAELRIRGTSERVCNSCFLAQKCPAFEEDATCAYDIPVEIRTRSQLSEVQNSLIEMQAQRVMFMRFAEEMEGGYSDPNLSSEIDRLQKMIKTKDELEREGFSIKIEGSSREGGAGPGMIARLFGDKASQAAQALPSSMSAEQVAETIDADIVEDPR